MPRHFEPSSSRTGASQQNGHSSAVVSRRRSVVASSSCSALSCWFFRTSGRASGSGAAARAGGGRLGRSRSRRGRAPGLPARVPPTPFIPSAPPKAAKAEGRRKGGRLRDREQQPSAAGPLARFTRDAPG